MKSVINTEAVLPTQQAFFDGSGADHDETTSPFYDQFQDVMVNLEDTGAFENLIKLFLLEFFNHPCQSMRPTFQGF